MCFVDIDNRQLDTPEDIPTFPYQSELKSELLQVLNKHQNLIGAEQISRKHSSTPRRESSLNRTKTGHSLSPNDLPPSGSYPNSPKRKDILQQSEAWKKISSLAKATGVWDSIEDIVLEDSGSSSSDKDKTSSSSAGAGMPASEVNDLKFNNAVREIFLNCFVHMFASYENFVIYPNDAHDIESWLSNRETMHTFDKAAFLSDQPAAHLPFLSAFTETQMFTSLMDNKIVSQWEENPDPNLMLFDQRIKSLRGEAGAGEPRIITYNACGVIDESGRGNF